MKKYYNIYNDASAYEADMDRKALESSTISKVEEDIVYDGINVETKEPAMGDAVYHDAEKQVHFIKGYTLNKGLLPSDYVAIGTCGEKQGENIFIIHKDYESKRFVEYFLWTVSGMILDGSPHTCETIKLRSHVLPAFTYTANTIEEFATQLDAHLKANCLPEKPHIAYVENGEVIMQLLKYSNWDDYNASISGLTVTNIVLRGIEISPSAYIDRGLRVYGVWNAGRAMEYFASDLESSSFNPTSPVSKEPSYPVCLPAYLGTSAHRDGDKCAALREKYGEGREGWEKYINANVPIIPYPKGMMSDRYLVGKEFTYKLVGQTAPDGNGGRKPQNPAAEYAASKGFEGVKGLEVGDWFGPNAAEFILNMKGITYGLSGITADNCDAINRTRIKMGLSGLSCASYSWLFSRCGSASCWHAGSSGSVGNDGLCVSLRVVPVALFPLKSI